MRAVFYAPGTDDSLLPLTHSFPKEIIPVLNKPLIVHHIENLRDVGITEFKIIVFNYPECIDGFLKNGESLGVEISYQFEKRASEGGLRIGQLGRFYDEPFLYISCGQYIELDYRDFILQHLKGNYGFSTLLSGPEKTETAIHLISPRIQHLIRGKRAINLKDYLLPRMKRESISYLEFRSEGLVNPLSKPAKWFQLNLDLAKTNNIENKKIIANETSIIAHSAELKGTVLIGNNCHIDTGARLSDCIIFDNTYIGKNVEIKNAVVNKSAHYDVERDFLTEIEEDTIVGVVKDRNIKQRIDALLIVIMDIALSSIGGILMMPIVLIFWIGKKLTDGNSQLQSADLVLQTGEFSHEKDMYRNCNKHSLKYYLFNTTVVGYRLNYFLLLLHVFTRRLSLLEFLGMMKNVNELKRIGMNSMEHSGVFNLFESRIEAALPENIRILQNAFNKFQTDIAVEFGLEYGLAPAKLPFGSYVIRILRTLITGFR